LNNIVLIIPAAGSGSRLGTDIPKPFIEIAGKSILEHTLEKFWDLPELSKVIIATSEIYLGKVEKMLAPAMPEDIALEVVRGGEERQHSIYNALIASGDSDYTIVHDAVRPFVKTGHIKDCFKAAVEVGASVLGVKAKDTIKRADKENVILETPSRKMLWQAQTPQIFKTSILLEAYQRARRDNFVGTDDASLAERLGKQVKMVKGDRMNFKITYPLDLKLAEILLEEK